MDVSPGGHPNRPKCDHIVCFTYTLQLAIKPVTEIVVSTTEKLQAILAHVRHGKARRARFLAARLDKHGDGPGTTVPWHADAVELYACHGPRVFEVEGNDRHDCPRRPVL